MPLYASYILLAVSILMGAAGQILFKIAALKIDTLRPNISSIIQNYQLFLGFSLYFISAMIYIISLKKIPLSIAYPCLATGYVLILFLSNFFFGEEISIYKILGVTLILVGVSLLVLK